MGAGRDAAEIKGNWSDEVIVIIAGHRPSSWSGLMTRQDGMLKSCFRRRVQNLKYKTIVVRARESEPLKRILNPNSTKSTMVDLS